MRFLQRPKAKLRAPAYSQVFSQNKIDNQEWGKI